MRIEPWGLITLAIARGRAVAVIKVIVAAAMPQIEVPRVLMTEPQTARWKRGIIPRLHE
jgi:hypothetical protein